jgi:8-oxo-dGTP pyrophosphatase MutT (NUDIX family)
MARMTQEEFEQSIARVAVVAGCVIKKNGKYLLVQEKQPKAYGLWNLPAGHVDNGETIEQAAAREAREETGFDVAVAEKLEISHDNIGTPVKHSFAARITGGELCIKPDEILDAKWLNYQEIAELNRKGKLRATWVWDSITKLEKSDT